MTKRGVTLPELLLVVVLLLLAVGIAVPRVAGAIDRAALRTARSDVLRALDAARGAAIRLGHPVDLEHGHGALRLTLATGDTITWHVPAPEQSGVALRGLATPIRFGPSGNATGVSNRTLLLSRGDDTLALVLSRLGRIRW
jgi:prepilin-type N-terminal cleavage/methylation domain-containing protein